MDLGLKNSEGYYDSTAYFAIKNVCKEEKKYKKLRLSARFIKKSKDIKKCKEVKS